MAYFTKPEEVLDYIHDLLDRESGDLGLKYVAYGDETMIPRYPAAKVAAGLLTKDLHGTHTWLNGFKVEVFVYHGKLTDSHAQRSKDDLELASSIRQLLHNDMTLGGNVVQGWVTGEAPVQIASRKSSVVVATRMTWEGQATEVFGMF